MKVVGISDAEVETWRAATKPVLDSYLAESGELGAADLQGRTGPEVSL